MKIRYLLVVFVVFSTASYSKTGALTRKPAQLLVASDYVVADVAKDCNEGIVSDRTMTEELNPYLFKCVNDELKRRGYRAVTKIWGKRFL